MAKRVSFVPSFQMQNYFFVNLWEGGLHSDEK